MTHSVTLRTALEREHREIDAGIEAFVEDAGNSQGLRTAFTALRRHIWLEEEFLFPPLRAEGLMGPVLVMLKEHGELWGELDEVDRLLADPGSAGEVRTRLQTLLEMLDRHNAKEEPIVYAAADQTLDPDTEAEINELIATSTLPGGWVCQQARIT